MNTDTGQVYRTLQAIREAEARGEPLVAVSEQVANAVETGMRHITRQSKRPTRRLWKNPRGKIRR